MSKQTKWVVGVLVLVIIVAAVWYFGSSHSGITAYPPVTSNTNTASVMITSTALSQINQDTADLDTQMSLATSELSTVSNASSQAQVTAVAKQLTTVSALVSKVNSEFAYSIAAQNLPTFQPSLSDITQQINNAQIQLSAVINNFQKTKSVASNVAQALKELQVAQNYLKTARNDIGYVAQALK